MTTEQKFAKLERTNRRWRWLAGALGLVAIVGVGAAQEAPKELVLKKLTIARGEGKAKIVLSSSGDGAGIVVADAKGENRIVAGTFPSGLGQVLHHDVNGNRRIAAGTSLKGLAGVTHVDANGKVRISADTFTDGLAQISHHDANGKRRIAAGTFPSGLAKATHYDAKGGIRIRTGTAPGGEAGTRYQNYNANGELKIVRSLP